MKLIIKFMIPMCLGNIFQQFYNIADSIVAGQFLGVDALAAIGSTGSLIFFVTGWLNGLTSGFSIWVAQWFGAQRLARMRHFIAMSIYICLFFVVIMTVGLLILNEPILRLMNSPEELMDDISKYMDIIYGGLFATCAYNAFSAVLRALGGQPFSAVFSDHFCSAECFDGYWIYRILPYGSRGLRLRYCYCPGNFCRIVFGLHN